MKSNGLRDNLMTEKSALQGSRRWFLASGAGLGTGIIAHAAMAGEFTHASYGAASTLPPQPQLAVPEISIAAARSLESIVTEGTDNIFPTPFEIDRMRSDPLIRERALTAIVQSVAAARQIDVQTSFVCGMIYPKTAMHAFRQCAFLDPMTSARYLTYALLAGQELEPHRATSRVFSNRLASSGLPLFDGSYNHQSFQTKVTSRLNEDPGTVLVSADISDFFNSIPAGDLVEGLYTRGLPAWLVEAISSLLWTWNQKGISGLPIGPQASAILAELFLMNTDDRLQSERVDYVRYVDDFHFFAPDVSTARRWLDVLRDQLATQHLVLNARKTSFENISAQGYADAIKNRRAQKLWANACDNATTNVPTKKSKKGALVHKHAKGRSVPKHSSPPGAPPPTQTPSRLPLDNQSQPPPTLPYQGQSPGKKAQLNNLDIEMLEQVDLASLDQQLRAGAAIGASLPLGIFRVFVEATLRYGERRRLLNVFDLLGQHPHCIPYFVDVLVAESIAFSGEVRIAARKWFATRLSSDVYKSDHELIETARLLGTDGYESPDAIETYLHRRGIKQSPIVVRSLVAALSGRCDRPRALRLAALCDVVDAITRRALLDAIWTKLDEKMQSNLKNRYLAEIQSDPFLAHLIQSPQLPETRLA
jgi:hypothetical protein